MTADSDDSNDVSRVAEQLLVAIISARWSILAN